MRSPRGFFASIVFLSLLPVTVLYQMFFDSGLETVTHLALAAGSILVSLAVFDFKTPKWVTWIGCLSMGALAVIFLLQALSLAVPNEPLNYLAFQVLGQRLEGWLVCLFIFWCAGMLLTDSCGKTRVLGFAVMSAVVCLEVYKYVLSFQGGTPAEDLKMIFLLLFVWLLLESM
jgi:hypothetical protein